MRLALVTHLGLLQLIPEDQLLVQAMKNRGAEVEIVAWDDPDLDLTRLATLDKVVIRSPWNYSEEYVKFEAWLTALENSGARVWNPVPLLRWNLDKHYLLELKSKGVTIAPSVFTGRKGLQSYVEYSSHFGDSRLVVKPTISAGARNTHLIQSQEELDAVESETSFIVQPFFDQIQSEGEWSILFFGNQHSHSILKKPAPGDFRVQPKHHGTWTYENAPRVLVDQARQILQRVPTKWLYARVDGVRRGKVFILMELELLEPQLFISDRIDLADKIAKIFLTI